MQIASYVIYELLIRLQELNPAVGDYISYKKNETHITVLTSTGTVNFTHVNLEKQFHEPESIKAYDLALILDSFKLSGTSV